MPNQLQPLPAAGCPKCGRAAEPTLAAATRCANLTADGPCDGSYRATLAAADWIVCANCHGSGATSMQRCAPCDGAGWHYARPRFP